MTTTPDDPGVTSIAEKLEKERVYSLHQLCEICQITQTTVHEFIEYDVIVPDYGEEPGFRQMHVDRVLKGVRLQRDLELNHAGVALALDLLDTIDQLKQEVRKLRVHTGRR